MEQDQEQPSSQNDDVCQRLVMVRVLDYFLGRFVVCISGSCFVAAIPFQNFSDDVAKSGMSITECAHKLKDMKADQLIADGGCYHGLRPGEGAVIPPGFMLFKCHPSCVADDCWALDEPAPPASEGLVMLASRESGLVVYF